VTGSSEVDFDWNDIPLLLALARTGSMNAAGKRLGVDPSTISRRLAATEAALQTPLFVRGPTGYQPTDAGRVFLENAGRIDGQVRDMLVDTRAEADGVGGEVRLTAIDFMFSEWLAAHLPALVAAHPALQLQLIASNQSLSFTHRETDLALRLARPRDDAALVMRKVGELGFAVYAQACFAGTPRERWGELPWLVYGPELAETPEMRWIARHVPGARRVIQVSSVATLRSACVAGLGLALLPHVVPEAGGVRRLGQGVELHRDVWLLSHRATGRIARYRAVSDWLVKAFETDASRLRGEQAAAGPGGGAGQP
jgi:DNA-binding transcriptional LysR family regulator